MSESTRYDRVTQNYELGSRKILKQNVREVGEDSPYDDFQPMLNEQRATHSNTLSVAQWPTQPRMLVEDPRWEILYDLYDSFLVIIALVLILKTSLCIYAFHKDKDQRGKYLDEVSWLTLNLIKFNEQVVTAFTIVFVTIMTTATRRYALYQAQKGAYITDLEQLQASISLPSTIKIVFSLRKFTKFSVALVFLWSFYYLGSQASKREYAYTISDPLYPMSAAYPATDMTGYFDLQPGQYDNNLNQEFISALWGNGDDKLPTFGIDDNGNLLLPDPRYLSTLLPNGTANDTRTFKVRPSETNYLSYSGRPLWVRVNYTYVYDNGTSGVSSSWANEKVIGDYLLHTSYIKFHCASMDVLPLNQFPANVQASRVVSFNISQSAPTRNVTNASAQQLEFWQRWNASTPFYAENGTLVNGPKVNGSDGGSLRITCNILEPRVNVNVHCTQIACLATRMSCPYVDPTLVNRTVFDNVTFANEFFNNMLMAEGTPETRDRSDWGVVTNFTWFDDATILQAVAGTLNSSEELVQLDSQSGWLENIVNTYLNLADGSIVPLDNDATPAGFEMVRILGAPWDPHYALFWEWIAIDYMANFVLLAAAIASFWLRKHTLVPDIFGFVSSLTRDNPHFSVPSGSSALDGISRTRALRGVKVKIGDIGGPHGEVGRVGFVPIHPTIPIGTLSKDRKYL